MTTLSSRQRRAERKFIDTCMVRYETGETAQNPDTGTIEPVYADLFPSPCKVQSRSLVVENAEVGGRTATIVRVELHLPTSSPDIDPTLRAVADITAVGRNSRTKLGRRLRIAGPVDKTYPTSLRYEVTEVVS